MASRILEILISAKDQATATLGKVQGGLTGFKAQAERVAKGVSDSLNSMVGRFLSVGAIVGVLKSASDAANELNASMRKLEGTAKIAGVPLQTLQEIANQGREAFGLSAVTANDLTVAVSKLATKAGDLGMSSDLMERFLDLGAAKGLSATDTLKAVEQSILGIDEGTDKLFGKNPSVLYEEFAASIGKSAGKLSDQEKAMAIATAAMDDGGKVVGAYRDYLESAAGKQDQARQKMQEAAATLGQALTPAFAAAADMVQWTGEQIQAFIGGIQIMAVELASAAMALGPMFKVIAGGVITMLGDMFLKLGDLPLVGDKFKELGSSLRASGQEMVVSNRQALQAIKDNMEDESAKIVGISTAGGKRQVQVAKDTQGALTGAATDGGGKRSKAEEATQKEIERLERESAVRQIQINEGLTDKQAEETYRRRELLLGATREQRDKLIALWKQMDEANLLLAAGFDKRVVPAVKQTTVEFTALRPPVDNLTEALEAARSKTAEVGDTGVSKARSFGDKLRELGEDAQRVVQKIAMIGDVLKGMLADGKLSLDDFANAAIDIAKKSGVPLLGAVATAVDVVKDLGSMLFGESPETKARKELVRQNTAALRGLTQATGDLLRVQASGNQITKIRDFLGGLFGPQGQYSKGAYTAGKMRTGITDAEVEALAAELGIKLRNSKTGAIESAALFQLFQGLQGLDSGFANTFKGQRERISTGIGLGAITQDQEFAQILKAIESQGGNNAILSALQGADFSTMEGRGAAANTLRDLFTAFGNNQIKADQLGGLSGSEFIDTLGDLIAILTDADRAITGVGDLRPDTPSLDLSTAFGDLSVTFEDIGMQQVDYLASIDTQIGGLLDRWTAPMDIRREAAAQALSISVGEVVVTTAATDAAGTGEAVQAAVTAAINQALADAYLDRQLATGNVTRTVS